MNLPFDWSRLSSRNNPNYFLTAFLVIGVSNKKHDDADRDPRVCHRSSPSLILSKRVME
jgi:hypothetical protein